MGLAGDSAKRSVDTGARGPNIVEPEGSGGHRMATSLNAISTLSANRQQTTVEIRNQTPFPVKVFRKLPQGKERPVNLLDGYRRYVQEASVGEEIIVRLACNLWEVARLTTTKAAQTCVIGEDVLRSRPSGDARVQVKLDVPVIGAALFLVDARGARMPVAPRVEAGTFVAELPVGSVLQGMDPRRHATYFWLIVTPAGEPNVLGQTFSTGTGWGVVPERGEVALFVDLALGRDASWEPTAAPSEPFFFLFHGDIPDVSALLASTRVAFPGGMRTATASLAAGNSPMKARTLEQVLEQQPPTKGAPLKSAGPVVLRAVAGAGTRAVFYESANFHGDDFMPDAGTVPGGKKLGSLKLEQVETAAEVGLRVLSSLSEDYEDDGKGGGKSITRFRATLICSPEVKYVDLSSWEDGATLEVSGKKYVVGPTRTARVNCNAFGRVVIKVDADEAGAPELMVRTSTMPEGTVVMVCPDEEMHQKIANMPDNALHGSGLAGAKYSAEDCSHVQKALQNISRAALSAHAETAAGVTSKRAFDASHMDDPHWVLSLDPKTGKPSYQALEGHEVSKLNAASSAEVHDVDAHLAQSIFSKAFKKVSKVVVSTAESAGKTVSNTAQQAGKTISNAAQDAGKTVSNTAQQAGNTISNAAQDAAKTTGKALTQAAEVTGKGVTQAAKVTGDGLVEAGKAVGQGLVVTVHFLEKNIPAVRFIVNESKRAAAAIKSVIQTIEVGIDKFVEWVRFLFDWKDVQRTHRVLENTVKGYFEQLRKDVPAFKEKLDGFIEGLREQLGNSPTPTASTSQEHAPATNPTHNGPLEKLEWFLDLLTRHLPGAKVAETATSQLLTTVWADLKKAMANVGQDVERFAEEFGELGKAMVKGDVKGVLEAAKGLATQLLTLALDVVHAVVDIILDAAIVLMDAFISMLTGKIEIPLISWLFKKIAGDEMSILGVGTLLMALPVTIGVKLITGEAPFQGVESLAQSRLLDVATAYASGVADVIAGIAGAYSTLKAAGPTVDHEGSPNSLLLTLSRILSVGKMFGYFAGALVIGNKSAKAYVMLASSIRATYQVFYLLDAERASESGRPDEVVADAMLGCVKLIAGGVELSEGRGTEGAIVILEGAGGLMELGGLMKNPVVVALASVAVSQTIWAAGVLQFVRGSKM